MSNSLFFHKAKQDITLNMSNILKYTQHLQIKDTTTSATKSQTLTKSCATAPLARTTNYPTEDDLFWCFYIMHFGLQKYTLIRNFFTEEKNVKIGFVEVIRKNKDILKQKGIEIEVLE